MILVTGSSKDEIKECARALLKGNLVVFPTETVYGLGADANNRRAVKRIYEAKARPCDHPLIVHIGSVLNISKWAVDIPYEAMELAKAFWPGPMTLVLKKSSLAADFVTGNQDTIGLRIPSNPIALMLLNEFQKLGGHGVAAPSANIFGSVSSTNAQQVLETFQETLSCHDYVIDGGQSDIGLESTIIDLSQTVIKVLRPGSISLEMITQVLRCPIDSNKFKDSARVSGMFSKHYAPKAKIVMNQFASAGDGFIAASYIETPPGACRLLAADSLEIYAKYLYTAFFEADKLNLKKICIIPPKGTGLAEAIRDRIVKASGI